MKITNDRLQDVGSGGTGSRLSFLRFRVEKRGREIGITCPRGVRRACLKNYLEGVNPPSIIYFSMIEGKKYPYRELSSTSRFLFFTFFQIFFFTSCNLKFHHFVHPRLNNNHNNVQHAINYHFEEGTTLRLPHVVKNIELFLIFF